MYAPQTASKLIHLGKWLEEARTFMTSAVVGKRDCEERWLEL